jgi:hypothetical protein
MNFDQPTNFKTIPVSEDTEGVLGSFARDVEGEKEAAAVAAGRLEEESKLAEHRRTERLRNHVNRAAVAMCVIA